MNFFYHFTETIQNFMSRGGGVLYLIFFVIFLLWVFIIERFWYFHFTFKKDADPILQKWSAPTAFLATPAQYPSHDALSSHTPRPSRVKPAPTKAQSGNLPPLPDTPNNWHKLLYKIQKADISRLSLLLNKNMAGIKILMALCPLLGLLGTVTGMIAVFEVMANVGTGNARLMASGISMATIPTMAGMVGALSGICITRVLEGRIKKEQQKITHFFAQEF